MQEAESGLDEKGVEFVEVGLRLKVVEDLLEGEEELGIGGGVYPSLSLEGQFFGEVAFPEVDEC